MSGVNQKYNENGKTERITPYKFVPTKPNAPHTFQSKGPTPIYFL